MSELPEFWMRWTRDAIGATSEVMFPQNDFGAPDWQQTQMVERTLDYLEELPFKMRRLVTLMFVAIELGAPFLLVGFGRFSRIPAARRMKALTSWRKSDFFLFRMLMDALKAQLCMMYLSHPDVQRHIKVFKTCERPNDPLKLPIRSGFLAANPINGLSTEAP